MEGCRLSDGQMDFHMEGEKQQKGPETKGRTSRKSETCSEGEKVSKREWMGRKTEVETGRMVCVCVRRGSR